jgi:transposase
MTDARGLANVKTEDERAIWLEHYKAGDRVSEIAESFGVSRSTVQAFINQHVEREIDPYEGQRKRVTLWMAPHLIDAIIEIAADRGYVTRSGANFGQGSPARLLEEIAEGKIALSRKRG